MPYGIDDITTWSIIDKLTGKTVMSGTCYKELEQPKVKQVIFNSPATIVYWTDGSKTVVKAVNEQFDEEKGFAMAYLKKVYGERNKYLKIIENATRQESKDR